MRNKYVVVDLETTGNAPKKGDRIIQFAAVVVEDGKIIEEYSSYVNPEQSIPVFIEELTGISDDMVKDSPKFIEIASKIISLLEDAYFVAHNVLFDASFLQAELQQAGYHSFYGPLLDTVEMARILFPTSDSYKLSDIAAQHGLNHARPHQADSDAMVTAELLLIILQKLGELPLTTIKQLRKLADGLKSDLDVLLDQIIVMKEKTIEELPSDLEIHYGIALKKLSTEKWEDGDDSPYPIQHSHKEQIIQKAFPSFEKRSGQFNMMDNVYQSFHNKQHSLIEAGTGVGKSLAYLLPAAFFAKEKKKPVVISTYTTQLQEQLLTKDLPLLKKMLPFSVKTVLLKGRDHYINLSKFERSLHEEDNHYDSSLTKMQILVWLIETTTGDKDELNLSSGGILYWNKIKHDQTIFGQSNPWHSKDYYLKARNDAYNADIILTNHALLLTDLVSDKPILPTYEYVMLDEGHHFAKAAGKYFGYSFDYLTMRILINQIGVFEQKQLFYKLEIITKKQETVSGSINDSFIVDQFISELQFEMDELFKIISSYAKKKSNKSSFQRMVCRLHHDNKSNQYVAMKGVAERFSFLLKDLIMSLQSRLDLFQSYYVHTYPKDERKVLEETEAIIKQLEKFREAISKLFLVRDENHVIWIEMDGKAPHNATTVYAQPIRVSQYLKEHFFSMKKSVVLTSATLTVNGSFHYILDELGLDSQLCKHERIESPFEYGKQVQLLIPKGLPEINTVPIEEYIISITEHIISAAEATKGRMLILFTSYDMLKKTYELMKESGFLLDYSILAQGITSGSRMRLTRNFRRFEKSILLGTNSFWEGIDIPGEDLSCLIIVRLPFSPPDEPLTEAKSEKVKQIGGNPFNEISLPEAVLRFKQGFGRLIRAKSDRGIIIVFDRRIVTASYGKTFLQSIPNIPLQICSIDEMVDTIKRLLP
ncbi:ATP-dependent DNA helicase DinG [Bacillus sp. 03113]|uniref:ATP-dependent DNA helicase DinG n=1 Tax=Bacillus sp. 03113 TaxID=2578211 RepID=UPI0011420284|nr:ATP-dependent DNA helicase DinG [Bacillus sp. 03113]